MAASQTNLYKTAGERRGKPRNTRHKKGHDYLEIVTNSKYCFAKHFIHKHFIKKVQNYLTL